jgi:hypothetical protein
MLDTFTADAFNVVSLTAAINRLPFVPSRLGSLNLFEEAPQTTTTAVVEYALGRLSLLQTGTRGGPSVNTAKSKKRAVKTFRIPHVPQDSEILADDIQGIRAFGSETELETHAALMNDRLESMRGDHELTHEYQRAGALCGVILDADGSTIYNLFTEFGITEDEYTLSAASEAGEQKVEVREIIRDIEDSLGNATYKGIHALCDDEFFDNLLKSPGVKEAYDRWQDGQFKRDQQGRDDGGFTYLGVTWENYRCKVGSTNFLQDTNVARFFPVGVKDLFKTAVAPADYMETVNTRGKLLYAKQEPKRFNKGVDLESQSNALFLCTNPRVLKKVTWGA